MAAPTSLFSRFDFKTNLLATKGVSPDPSDFSRGTEATYIDANTGLIVLETDIEAPRFEAEGLLLEGESTNLLEHSEDLSDVKWVKTNSSIGGASTVAPDGSVSTTSRLQSITGSTEVIRQIYPNANIEGETFIASCWFKAEGANIGQEVDLIVKRNGGGAAVQANKVVVLNGEWQREVVGPFTGIVDNEGVRLLVANNRPSKPTELLMWGAQLERQTHATSYIPTVAVGVGRAPEFLDLPAANWPVLDTPWSVGIDSDIHAPSTGQMMVRISASSDFLSPINTTAADTYRLQTTGVSSIAAGIDTLDGPYRTMSTWEAAGGTQIIYVDGVSEDSDSPTVAVGGNIGSVRIGRTTDENAQLYGNLKNLRIYDSVLTQEEIDDEFLIEGVRSNQGLWMQFLEGQGFTGSSLYGMQREWLIANTSVLQPRVQVGSVEMLSAVIFTSLWGYSRYIIPGGAISPDPYPAPFAQGQYASFIASGLDSMTISFSQSEPSAISDSGTYDFVDVFRGITKIGSFPKSGGVQVDNTFGKGTVFAPTGFNFNDLGTYTFNFYTGSDLGDKISLQGAWRAYLTEQGMTDTSLPGMQFEFFSTSGGDSLPGAEHAWLLDNI